MLPKSKGRPVVYRVTLHSNLLRFVKISLIIACSERVEVNSVIIFFRVYLITGYSGPLPGRRHGIVGMVLLWPSIIVITCS